MNVTSREPSIRLMRLDDVDAADALRQAAGWNQTREDWRRFLSSAPRGCFVAEQDGRVTGTATATCYGPELGWVGMLLVHPDQRRRGIGSELLKRSIEHLESQGVRCVKLDATPAGQPLYEQFGFRPEQTLTRWERTGGGGESAAQTGVQALTQGTPQFAAPGVSIVQLDQPVYVPDSPSSKLSAADLDRLVALDQAAFGVRRTAVLTAVVRQSVRAAIARSAHGNLAGVGLLRAGSRAKYLGPVQAGSTALGLRLLEALLAGCRGDAVYWDVLDANRAATGLAQALGFTSQRPLLRMFRGENLCRGEPDLQFGIIDPAVG